jgi:stringent starvation protein B|tara:strand:- start:974 stop:1192 length:219 start_codon:yes stop_codon:yes gene_type:complete
MTHKSLTPHIVVLFMMHVVKSVMKFMAASAIVVTHTPSKAMQALQVAGLGSLFCIAFIGMMYGELLLLNKLR